MNNPIDTEQEPYRVTFYQGPPLIFIYTPKGKIKINTENGRVELPEGLDLDEASRAFWDAINNLTR